MQSFFVRYLNNLETALSPSYTYSSTALSILVGIIASQLIIITAILLRKRVAFSIITALSQIVGAFSFQKAVHFFLQTDFVRNRSDLHFYAALMDSLLPCIAFSLIAFLSWVLGLIFVITSMKNVPRAIGVVGLLLHVIRLVHISPVNLISPLFGQLTEPLQMATDFFSYGAFLLPFLMVMIGSVASRVRAKYTAPVPLCA